MTSALPTRLAGPLAVETHDLVKRFGEDTALRGVGLQVPVGAVYALIGQNGAGKSTALKILLDLIRPTEGRADVLGMDTREHGPLLRAQIGYVPEQYESSYGWMRLDRLIAHHAVLYPAWDHDYALQLIQRFELKLQKQVRTLSKGQARRVQILLALAHRPRVLILDEPFEGLDPLICDEMLGLIAEHTADGHTTTIISTHLIHNVERIVDHIGVMRDGQLIAQTQREEMRQMLRRYDAEVPSGWQTPPGLNGALAQRSGLGRQMQWLMWGDERAVTAELLSAGARVTAVSTLSLEESALALLRNRELV